MHERIGMRRRMTAAPLLVVIALGVGSMAPTTAVARTRSPDTVLEWNQHATDALIVTGLQGPTVSILHLAMVHGAVYDAVNAITGRREPYLVAPPAERRYSKKAAAAAAAFHVLVSIVPAQEPELRALYEASLEQISGRDRKSGGIAVGEAAAEAMIAERTGDGRFGAPGFPIGDDPGEWRPVLPLFVNDPAAWVADVDPFLVGSASRFRSDGPDELTSRAYADDVNEVQSIGQDTSTSRSADQTDAARFWAEHAPAMWTRIARDLSRDHDLTLAQNARLFAMLYMTGADALITAWDDKRHRGFWRPITAIREAADDQNPATEPDEDWLPLLATPPYPEHPSGHTSFSGSVVATLQDFFGTDRMRFGALSAASGTTRSFNRFSQAIEEIIDARVYSGIHFRNADEQGAKIGRQVARFRDRHFFGKLG
jgi:hypothetical protein